jgi:hypothetical protein
MIIAIPQVHNLPIICFKLRLKQPQSNVMALYQYSTTWKPGCGYIKLHIKVRTGKTSCRSPTKSHKRTKSSSYGKRSIKIKAAYKMREWSEIRRITIEHFEIVCTVHEINYDGNFCCFYDWRIQYLVAIFAILFRSLLTSFSLVAFSSRHFHPSRTGLLFHKITRQSRNPFSIQWIIITKHVPFSIAAHKLLS